VVVDFVFEAFKQFLVCSIKPITGSSVFERVPILVAYPLEVFDVELWEGGQSVRAKWFCTRLVGQVFRNLRASARKCMNRYGICIGEKEREGSAELTPGDFSFVELH
jgi:hypothetical protein